MKKSKDLWRRNPNYKKNENHLFTGKVKMNMVQQDLILPETEFK